MGLFKKDKLTDWAKENNLNYQKKVKLGFIRSANVALADVMWGEYNGERVYAFKVIDSTVRTHDYTFFNGQFYAKIKKDDVESLIKDQNYLEITHGIFGGETDIEVIQTLVAQMYLQNGVETDYASVQKVYKSMQDFYKSKTSAKERFVGGLLGLEKSDITYNGEECVSFIMEKNSGIEKAFIESVTSTYEKLLNSYNQKH